MELATFATGRCHSHRLARRFCGGLWNQRSLCSHDRWLGCRGRHYSLGTQFGRHHCGGYRGTQPALQSSLCIYPYLWKPGRLRNCRRDLLSHTSSRSPRWQRVGCALDQFKWKEAAQDGFAGGWRRATRAGGSRRTNFERPRKRVRRCQQRGSVQGAKEKGRPTQRVAREARGCQEEGNRRDGAKPRGRPRGAYSGSGGGPSEPVIGTPSAKADRWSEAASADRSPEQAREGQCRGAAISWRQERADESSGLAARQSEHTIGSHGNFGGPQSFVEEESWLWRLRERQEEAEEEGIKEEESREEKEDEKKRFRRRRKSFKFQLKLECRGWKEKEEREEQQRGDRRRLAAAAGKEIEEESWISFGAFGESSGGATFRNTGKRRRIRFSIWRHQDGELLPPYDKGKQCGPWKPRQPRTVPIGQPHRLATLWKASPFRRRVSVKIPRHTTGDARRCLDCGAAFGNLHARYFQRSRQYYDFGSSETCEADGSCQRCRDAKVQRRLLQPELGKRSRMAGVQLGRLRRIRKRKIKEEQRQGQRRLWKRQGRQAVVFRVRMGRDTKRRRQGEAKREGADRGQVASLDTVSLSTIGHCSSLGQMGVALWLVLLKDRKDDNWSTILGTDAEARELLEKMCQGVRVPRKKRELFPLPSLWSERLAEFDVGECFLRTDEKGLVCSRVSLLCWCELVVVFLNYLHSKTLGIREGRPTAGQKDLLLCMEHSLMRVLRDDSSFRWDEIDIENDFKKRTLSYEGEEIAKAEELSVRRVLPALPPQGHGGCIELSRWISGRTQWYLEHPFECVQPDGGQELPSLQAKVHIRKGEQKELACLLVDRGVCTWVPEGEVLRYRDQMVLNGLFGVEKSGMLPTGETPLRCIMNLIPSNALLRPLEGHIHHLPHISQWLNVCLGTDEQLRLYQSDMVSAFYLFRLPEQWARLLCFNLSFFNHDLGLELDKPRVKLYLSCRVLPMGWSSAVGLMQQIAQQVLWEGGLPLDRQVRKDCPVPEWMTRCDQAARQKETAWWHVYLDNYAGGAKVTTAEDVAGSNDQEMALRLWKEAGIVSSEKKEVRGAKQIVELGAFVGGGGKWIGGSPERMVKTIKGTLFSLLRKQVGRKRLQMLLGRWVFLLQFRRPAMSGFEDAWSVIGKHSCSRRTWRLMKLELLLACCGCPLFHTWLGARIDLETTCSDASGTGGAIARSIELSGLGQQFLQHLKPEYRPQKVPVILVSLFNGIGGANRCYDIAGVEVIACLTVDIHKPANRVCSRRWANGEHVEDVRELTKEKLEGFLMKHETFEEIHLWAGFPCVDLSSAKANRMNLEGKHSSLVHEAKRIMQDIKELYPEKVFKFVVENVASMDIEARDSISELLGVIPYRLDPTAQVPMSRPRFSWTNVTLDETEEISLIPKSGYIEVLLVGEWPSADQWLDPGCEQIDPRAIYPTFMKAIVRNRPPFQPAGIQRTDWATQQRWREHQFRYPPYQYREEYLIYDSNLGHARVLNANERERLMGYGSGHTKLAYSASAAKLSPSLFEDERCSLIGDSFAISSFMIFAATAVKRWTGTVDVTQMNHRLGLPPGLGLKLNVACPMSVDETILELEDSHWAVSDLNEFMLRRTNHTGSDVRIVTSTLMNPRRYPRQSVNPQWWDWQQIFATRWKFSDQINSLEIRSIYLTLLWKLRERTFCSRRLFHLTDSYVAMSILSKGRTSSKALQPLVRKLASLVLAGQAQLILAHVDSSENPTDEGSRI